MTRRTFLGQTAAALAAGRLVAAPGDATVLRSKTYTLSNAVFADPERGLVSPVDPLSPGPVAQLRSRGVSVVLVELDLRDFKTADLSAEKLAELDALLKVVRTEGLKAIVRPAYGFMDQDAKCDPSDLKRITGHIAQLGETLATHLPVVCGVQAGMLGPRGDWRASTAGDPPSLAARRAVLNAWLATVPDPVPVSVPRPCFVRDLLPGPALTDKTAHTAIPLARVGWYHDDLGSAAGEATVFSPPGWGRDREMAWAAQHARFTPFGGTVGLSASDTPVADVLRDLRSLRTVYLNGEYPAKVLDAWSREPVSGGNALQVLTRSLGHRLAAQQLRYAPAAKPGGTLAVDLELTNTGFAAPHLPRSVAFVLTKAERVHRVSLQGMDPRRWEPGAKGFRVQVNLPLPATLPAGTWKLALHLADASPDLRSDGRYALRLANEDIPFDETTGYNVLADDIIVG